MTTNQAELSLTDELIAAAEKLDALIAEATDGPWAVSLRNGGSTVGIEGGDRGYDEVVMPGDVSCMSHCYGGTSTIDATEADWRYIATMNPLVGHELAVLMRISAEALLTVDADEQRDVVGDKPDYIPHPVLRIARLINGSAS